ncbi:unnamed protein product [Choristocarpus tenellus]
MSPKLGMGAVQDDDRALEGNLVSSLSPVRACSMWACDSDGSQEKMSQKGRRWSMGRRWSSFRRGDDIGMATLNRKSLTKRRLGRGNGIDKGDVNAIVVPVSPLVVSRTWNKDDAVCAVSTSEETDVSDMRTEYSTSEDEQISRQNVTGIVRNEPPVKAIDHELCDANEELTNGHGGVLSILTDLHRKHTTSLEGLSTQRLLDDAKGVALTRIASGLSPVRQCQCTVMSFLGENDQPILSGRRRILIAHNVIWAGGVSKAGSEEESYGGFQRLMNMNGASVQYRVMPTSHTGFVVEVVSAAGTVRLDPDNIKGLLEWGSVLCHSLVYFACLEESEDENLAKEDQSEGDVDVLQWVSQYTRRAMR